MTEIGIQFHLPSHGRLTTSDLVRLGRMAEAGGVSQLWATDNLQSRSLFVVLAALAASTSLKLGTAVLVQYFRNPVEVAGALAALTELMDGDELSVGIGRGNITTSTLVETPRPLTFMKETSVALRRLLAGEELASAEVPLLTEYFHLDEQAKFRLGFRPAKPVVLYCGGDGPRSLDVGARHMDGLLVGPMFRPLARTGRLEGVLETFTATVEAAGRHGTRRRVAEVKLALSADPVESRHFARNDVANRVLGLRWRGFGTDELARLGIGEAEMSALADAKEASAAPEALAGLVTDSMIDAFYIAGDLDTCREELARMMDLASANAFDQVLLSGIGPDLDTAIRLLLDDVLPSLP